MGMFDTYRTALRCPLDERLITEWQGKDGPCLLLTFKPGRAEPTRADEGRRLLDIDEDKYLADFDSTPGSGGVFSLSRRDQAAFGRAISIGAIGERLPPVFTFGARCGDHFLEAFGETDSEAVWRQSRIVQVYMYITKSTETVQAETEARYGRPVHLLELFRQGVLNESVLAERQDYHAARRAELAGHGGAARCSRGWRHRDETPPAEAWLSDFLCHDCCQELSQADRIAVIT